MNKKFLILILSFLITCTNTIYISAEDNAKETNTVNDTVLSHSNIESEEEKTYSDIIDVLFSIYETSLKPLEDILDSETESNSDKNNEISETKENIQDLIKPSPVIATVQKNTTSYTNSSLSKKGVVFKKDTSIIILASEGSSWYSCLNPSTAEKGWLPASALNIPPDPETNTNTLTKEQLEAYVNSQNIESKTNNLVWTDLDRQLTYIFKGSNGSWELVKTFSCATGKNVTPTPRGEFTVGARGSYFTGDYYRCKNYVQIQGDYLYHSVLFNKKGTAVINDTLGTRASHGCIRLSPESSKWIYDNIKKDTKIWIY